MEFHELSARALAIHRQFAETARSNNQPEWSREQIVQGFVGDVGDLVKLSMAKAGVRQIDHTDSKFAHELSDCLWSVLVIAKLYEVDLEKEFSRTMNAIETKLRSS